MNRIKRKDDDLVSKTNRMYEFYEESDLKEYLDFFKAAGIKKSFFAILDECGCVVPEPKRFAGRFFFKKSVC